MNRDFLRHLRTLVILGRVSNLPTVWSNCLVGWLLGGGENYANLPWLFFGVTALYLGGMYLNDAFDADFDRQHRPERPIPSGAISLPAVWGWGLAWLVLGALSLITIGKTTGALALVLLLCIVVYDATHKVITASPWLMGLCRFWIYVIAGSCASWGVNGWPIWCGVALAFYVAGLSHVARLESSRGRVPYWPLALLAAPVLSGHVDGCRRKSRSRPLAVARPGALDRALCAANFSGRRSERGTNRFRPAGGNCVGGLAGGRAGLSARIERGVFNPVRRNVGASTIRAGNLKERLKAKG